MARSPTPSRPGPVPFHAPQGAHLALAVGLPTVFCGLAAYWLAGAGPNAPQGVNLVYTVLVSLWSSWRLRTKQGPWLRLWVWVMLALACYTAQAGLEGLPMPQTFAFGGTHLLWFLLGLFQAQIGALWAGQLAARARLFQLTAGVPDGKELELAVREYQLDADFSASNRAVLTWSLAVLAATAAVLASVSREGTEGLSAGLFAGFFGLCLMAGVLVRTYRREMESMMYGRRWTWGEKLAPLGWSALLAAAAGLGALGLLNLGPWFDGIGFPNASDGAADKPVDAEPPASPVLIRDPRAAVLAAILERLLGLDNLLLAATFIVRAVAFVAPWAVAAFLVWPLVRWVASGGRETRGLLRRWRELLAAQWRAFLKALGAWWGAPRDEPRPLGRRAAQEWLRSFLPKAGSRRGLSDLIEAFLKVVAWAEPAAAYRRGETTREFLNRVAAALPETAHDLAAVRDALELGLFGPGLDPAARAALLARVRALTSRPAVHDGSPGVS